MTPWPSPGAGVADDLVAGRYRVTGLMARGGMADVYEARDERLQRDVAIKVFRSGDGDLVRFEHETELLAGLQHPNLVGILDGGEEAGTPFVVLDRCPSTLSEEITRGPLAPGRVARVGRDVASALAYTHAQGIVHRDIKPSNILIGTDRRALLADFGIARLVDGTRLTRTGLALGTAAYLAPEQAAGEATGPPADIYSLGLVLIEALTGQVSFQGTPREQLAARLTRGPRIPDSLSPPWPKLLAAMTASDPARRPAAAEVEEVLSGGDLPATAAMSPADRPTAPMPIASMAAATTPGAVSRPRWRVLAVLAAAVIAGIALASAVSGDGGVRTESPPTTATTATTTPVPTTAAPEAETPPAPAGRGPDGAGPPGRSATCDALEEKQAVESDERQSEKQNRTDKERRKQIEQEKQTSC